MHTVMLMIALLLEGAVSTKDQASGYKYPPFDCTLHKLDFEKRYCVLRNEESAYIPNCTVGEFWDTQMSIDDMTDKKSCSVSPALYNKEAGGLFVHVERSEVSFSIMGDEYPGEPMSIRVDKNQVFTFQNFLKGKRAGALLSQISSGKLVLTEYQDWPYNTSNVRSVPICDLPKKIKACRDFLK